MATMWKAMIAFCVAQRGVVTDSYIPAKRNAMTKMTIIPMRVRMRARSLAAEMAIDKMAKNATTEITMKAMDV